MKDFKALQWRQVTPRQRAIHQKRRVFQKERKKRTGRQLFQAKTSWGEQMALTWVQVDSSGGLHGCSCPGRRCSTRFHRSARTANVRSTSFYINSIQTFAKSHVFPVSCHHHPSSTSFPPLSFPILTMS